MVESRAAAPVTASAPTSNDGHRRVRVLHVIKGLGPGGAERLLCAAAAVRDRSTFDYEVAYVVPWKNHLAPELVDEGVTVHCVGTGDGRAALADPRWAARLGALIRRGGYDVVHVHSPLVAAVVRTLVRAVPWRRPALVSTEHNAWSTFAPLTRTANGLTYGLDDVRFAVSDEVRSSVSPRLRPSVEVAVHGVRVDAIRAVRTQRAAVRAQLGATDDDILVGTVANYLAQKAYPDLFAAARRVLDEEPRVRFVAVGQGPLQDTISAEHARLSLGDRFTLLGYRPDAVRVLAGCDVFTLASHFEGLPVALMEALAVGLPVVTTAVGGIPDHLRDGREGLLVPPRRPDLLAEAVLKVVRDDTMRTDMGRHAAELAVRFDIRDVVRRIEGAYLDVLGDPRAPERERS